MRSALLVLLATGVYASPVNNVNADKTILARDSIPVVDTSIPLYHRWVQRRNSSSLRARDTVQKSTDWDLSLNVQASFNGAPVYLLIDTGSSNLWVISGNYQCIDVNGNTIGRSNCNFGPSKFKTSTATPIADPSFFNTGYASGEYVIGAGYVGTVEIAGIKIPNQSFGVATKASWNGDGFSSGLIGLGSLYGNQIWYGSSVKDVSNNNMYLYDNPAVNAWKQGLTSALHTLAINRIPFSPETTGPQAGGYFTLGGRPAETPVTDVAVTLPVLTWTASGSGAFINEQAYSEMVATVSWTFNGSETIDTTTTGSVGLDSGDSGLYLTETVFNAWIANAPSGNVPCDGSTVPALTITINGVDFPWDTRDLLAYIPDQDLCYINVGIDNEPRLNAPFLRNNVVTWDKQANTVTIMQRVPY